MKHKYHERYNSGTSLRKTKKEERIGYLEDMVMQGQEGAFSDRLFTELKGLTVESLKELHQLIAERITTEQGYTMIYIGQAPHMGKWEAHTAMIRLVRDLGAKLDEAGLMSGTEQTAIDNVVYAFLAVLPNKVGEDVLHG